MVTRLVAIVLNLLLAAAPLLFGQSDVALPADVVPASTFVSQHASFPFREWSLGWPSSLALLYDNGPLVTHPGVGGAPDTSRITAGLNTFGFPAQLTTLNRVADDVLVQGGNWQVDSIVFFTYQTNSGTTSTINHLNLRIWNGLPEAGTLVWGDTTTNRLGATYWANMYRRATTGGDNTRPVMVARANTAGLSLAGGTYWMDFQLGGTLASGPWVPPISIIGQPATGNGRGRTSGLWAPLVSGGDSLPQGLPFRIYGTLQPYANDIRVDSVLLSPPAPVVGSTMTIAARIKWLGTAAPPATVNVTYKAALPPASFGDGVPQTFSPAWVNNAATVTFTTPYIPGIPGSLTIYVRSFHAGDQDPSNNIASRTITVGANIDIGVAALFLSSLHDETVWVGPESSGFSPSAANRGQGSDAWVPLPPFMKAEAVTLSAVVQNFGSAPQNSYQVGWEVDGIPKPGVSNTETLDVGDADTLLLHLGGATVGPHTARAWTILAGDNNQANDTSGVLHFEVLPPNVVFQEGFNRTSFPPPGWVVVNADGGGTSTWTRTEGATFPPFEGSAKASRNFLAANGFIIDEWLITPNTGSLSSLPGVDSLVFWTQSNSATTYRDSIEIRVSTTGQGTGNFTTLLGYIDVPKGSWTRFSYVLPTNTNRWIAFRYRHLHGGISGTSSDFVALDDVRVIATTEVATNVLAGWNIVSNPVLTTGDSVRLLFPTSLFNYGFAFRGTSGYVQAFRFLRGEGYWAKFPAASTVTFFGTAINEDSITVAAGWNLVGSISVGVDTADISSTPPGIVTSNYYNFPYGTGESTLLPGKGYWVKASAPGKIHFHRPGLSRKTMVQATEPHLENLNTISFRDASATPVTLYFGVNQTIDLSRYELPPTPPMELFDARFESPEGGQLVQTHEQGPVTLPILIQSTSYPVTVTWKVPHGEYLLTDDSGLAAVVKGRGSVVLNHATIRRIVLQSTDESGVPTEYALEQTYPNPFNPKTSVKFAVPVQSHVTIRVFNALGQCVRTLVSGTIGKGIHVAVWDGVGDAGLLVGTGVYFVRFEATGIDGRGFSDARKAVLLK